MIPSAPTGLALAIFVLQIVGPFIILVSLFSTIPLRRPSHAHPHTEITQVIVPTTTPRRTLILFLLSLASLTYLTQGLVYVIFTVLSKHWSPWSGVDSGAVIGIIALSGLATLGAWKELHGVNIWGRKRVKVAVAYSLLCDVAIVVLIAVSIKVMRNSPHIPERRPLISLLIILHLACTAARILLFFVLLFALYSPRTTYTPVSQPPSPSTAPPQEASLLLSPSTGLNTGLSPLSAEQAANHRKYGTFPSNWSIHPSNPTTRATTPVSGASPLPKIPPPTAPEIALDPSWRELGRRIRRLSPYLWPSKSRPLQVLALICIILLILGRIINVLLPLTLGKLVKVLENRKENQGWRGSPWVYLGGYVVLRFLQSSGGLGALRDSLWAPVMQYSDREMSQLSFDHILNLSFAWHTRRKTGEILRILDRGASINHTLELLLFNIIPTFLDIIIALGVFVYKFEWTLALVIFIVMFAYVAASVILTKWRTKIRRQMNDRDVITRGIHTDCLLNYETVKYFGGEVHEGQRYADAIREYQTLEYKVIISLNLLNLIQNFIITLGLLVGSMIVALRVVNGKSEPSDFVIFITYLAQLYGPLNSLGYIYRSMNQSLVDTERLLKLLNEPTEVNDKPDAADLVVDDGEIEFDNVSFSYDNRTTALSSVSFKVPKGSSVALVGESGSGKSTILRLLYRFYDLNEGEGRILIDGKDIRDVTQASLRRAIGVVPQDSVLFNSSIGYNIGYGKFDASLQEIELAAKAAQMHDRIMSFADGYETKVGERGVRLSGGEKQRVAIARTLLKNPPILLLDEATSALDTSTEKDIQKALQNLVKGRSSLSIAHRLSTIASADIILVLKDGQIVEKGSHKELLALDGIFASMWTNQISASDDPAISLDNDNVKREASSYFPFQETEAKDVMGGHPTDTIQPGASVPSEDGVGPGALGSSYTTVATPDVAPDLSAVATPVAFPASDDTGSQRDAPAPAVSFPSDLNQPPSRSGTPDPEGEAKKKMITGQGFHRLARRISLGTRRTGSSSSFIPGFGRKEGSKDETNSLRGEGSTRDSIDSHGGSEIVEGDKSKIKKERKDKKDKTKKRKSVV